MTDDQAVRPRAAAAKRKAMSDTTEHPLADPQAWRRAFVDADEWAAAVKHSRANPTHILGPYQDEEDRMQIECTGCDFDTARRAPGPAMT